MINYNLKNDNIFYVDVSGDIQLSEAIDFLKKFETIKNLPLNLAQQYNLHDVNFNIKIDQLQEISQLVDKVTSKYLTVKTAIVSNDPRNSAMAILFSQSNSNSKNIWKLFSTEVAAVGWLLQAQK